MKRSAWLVAAGVVGAVITGYLCSRKHRRIRALICATELVRLHREEGSLQEGVWLLGAIPDIVGWQLPMLELFALQVDRILQSEGLKVTLHHDESPTTAYLIVDKVL